MKKYKPTSPGRRDGSVIDYRSELSPLAKKSPHKPLTGKMRSTGGRNSQGRITNWYRGAGNKRAYRHIDNKYEKHNIPAKLESIEYDPNRSGFIALVCYADGERRYVLVPKEMKVGDVFEVGENVKVKTGNRMPLGKIPTGTKIYNLELKPRAGSRLARSAGNYAEVVAHDSGYTQVRLPSSEIRKIISTAWASVGEVSNSAHRLVSIGKAGRARHMGLRPKTRGSARNAVDHPHGGGESRSPRGHRRSRTKQGRPTGKGQKTRAPKKYSNKFIVSRRKPGKIMGGKR